MSNTAKGVDELARSDKAIVLENALLDTGGRVALDIPASLRSAAPVAGSGLGVSSYIVQSRGPVDEGFRRALGDAGAQIISYIPNNAYLVRASEQTAQQLAGQSQAVVAYEPYYKLQGRLLEWAVDNESMPPGSVLNVVLFADAEQEALNQLRQLGAEVVTESPSPFGPVARVRFNVRSSSLSAIAQLNGVQNVSLASARKPANDLSRVKVGVAADSVSPTNYLGLSGSNVVVQVNDTGVDASHPDLSGRVFGTALSDPNGHGTHVAGIIASSGEHSDTVTNASGSVMPGTNGQFRGMAPGAGLYSLPAFAMSDFELQEAAARTNALISNNSWNYAETSYDINAASYDAAARDALPEVTGSQPVLFVFSAGDGGGGDDSGLSGSPQSIQSPATAKNGITVGAVEQPRGITNEVVDANGNTNQVWLGRTDSGNQVAGFSARGNVGIGIEGDFGRFKPDVVAPGVFVVSTTEKDHWDQVAYYNPTNHHFNTLRNQVVETNTLHNYAIFVPDNAVRLSLTATATSPSVNLPIYAKAGDFAGLGDFRGNDSVTISPVTTGVMWFYAVGNPTNEPVLYDVSTELVTTNDNGNYFEVLSNLNEQLGPYYRYESGTSMSAADVSGVLALMEDFFTNQLHTLPSPALLKAMLINGARPASVIYDFQVNGQINYQGWGLVNLTNSLPAGLTNGIAGQGNGAPMLLFEQNPTNALATGQRHTVNVAVDAAAADGPLRVTLVWTDPPGNPAAGIKLVNDLDLVVTNLDTGEVFYGNDIGAGANFTFPSDTNAPPNRDFVNNVENVYLSPRLGTNYAITVIGQRVNVNAVSAQTNNVAQDYALVISAGDGSVSNALVIQSDSGIVSADARNVTQVGNQFPDNPENRISGQLLLGQHVGASSPLLGTNTIALGNNAEWGGGGVITLGVTNQWHFYMMTNGTDFTNAAFATFLTPDLGLPRMGVTNVNDPANATRVEADIDLYVSTNPGLTNLDPAVLAGADKSLSRGGTEVVVYTNAQKVTYYIAVKAEDQEAAEYAFFGVFSQLPFSTQDADGVLMRGINVPMVIPDGSPAKPGAALVLSIAAQPVTVRRVVVTNDITHENFGDLLGNLSHSQKFAVLNNHSFGGTQLGSDPTERRFIYEDNGENDLGQAAQHTDGPGNLRDFVGEKGAGVWLLSEADNALTHTGSVDRLWIRLEPQADTNGLLRLTIAPNSFKYTSVDVPIGATNLIISVTNLSNPALPLQLYVRRDGFPTQTTYDYTRAIPNTPAGPFGPGATLSIDTSDLPPLKPGRYYIGVYNPNGVAQTVQLFMQILPAGGGDVSTVDFTAAGASNLLDDAVSYSTIVITNPQKIVSLDVGVAIQHPRISDLVLTLISPTGQRYLLMENRGGTTANAGSIGSVNSNVIAGPIVNPDNGHYYYLLRNTNWTTSEAWAIQLGGHLATINDANENAWVFSTFGAYGGTNRSLWIGLNDAAAEGNFVWANGDPVTFTSWQPGEPNNFNGNEDYVYMYAPGQGADQRWNDYQDLDTIPGGQPPPYGVVEANLIPTPQYLTFTENTNLAQVPIKFATAPFLSTNTSTAQTLSDFESISPGEYVAPVTVGGWSVDTNQISVVNDPTNAQSGNKLLALANGSISRTLTTTPGNKYTLSLGYRGPGIVGLWRGENNGVDSINGNNGNLQSITFTNGEVGQAFNCLPNGPVIPRVSIPDQQIFKLTNSLSIEGWIRPIGPGYTVFWRGDDRAGFDPYFLSMKGNNAVAFYIEDVGGNAVFVQAPIAYNQWWHVAGTLDGSSGLMRLYINGNLVNQVVTATRPFADLVANLNPRVCIGNVNEHDNFPFAGAIDEISLYSRALSESEVRAIYTNGVAGKFDSSVSLPGGLAETQVSIDGLTPSRLVGDNNNWTTTSFPFTATQSSTPVQITGLEPGMLLDNITLTEQGRGLYYFPEESLQSLVGQEAQGAWTLEVRDARGLYAGTNLSWQLQFVFETNTPTPISLVNSTPATNTVPPCQIAYYIVDVPSWASYATNILVSASAPVQVWFNQDTPPAMDGANPGDILLLSGTSDSKTLSTNTVPPLIPGARYYLGVENPCSATTNADVVLRVDFDTPIITLTNAIAYFNTNSGVLNPVDYYHFVISNNAVRAQFEINNPSGDVQLAVRKGQPPLPSLTTFDYESTNSGTSDELILAFTNSTPVALTPGDWYLAAINVSGGPVSYEIKATQWTVTGQPINITGTQIETNGTNSSFCISWESLIGAHYYVEGITNLGSTNWDVISPTITATDTNTTFCIDLPTPYQFFRVVEGLSPGVSAPPAQPVQVGVTQTPGGFLLQWTGPPDAQYQVQWTPGLSPPGWNTFPGTVTSTTTQYSYLDDGSQTGGLGPQRFYQVIQVQ